MAGRHLGLSEVPLLAGSAFLLLPAAEHALEREGAWAIVVLLESMLLVAGGLALNQRWLVVSGALGLGGTALRYTVAGDNGDPVVPAWAALGLAGMVLLSGGLALVLANEWWDRTRERVAGWWMTGAGHGAA